MKRQVYRMVPALKFIAYYRVSTKRQGISGLGLDAQKGAVAGYLAEVHGQLVAEFCEIEHGTRRGNNRPVLAEAMKQCRIHRATLIIAKLDRLARSVHFVSGLMESGVEFVACDYPTANRLTIHIIAAMAEHEAQLISERTKVALAAAKRRGTILGGARDSSTCRKGAKQSGKVRAEHAQRRAADLLPVIAAIKAEGSTSLHQIAAGLNQRGIPAARGGMWSATQVSRTLCTCQQ